MTDEKKFKSQNENLVDVSRQDKNSEIVTTNQTIVEIEPKYELEVAPIPKRNPDVAAMVKRLSRVGLNQTAVAIAAKISPDELRKYYMEDFHAGQASMQEVVATAAMEQVMAGNPQMIQFMAKTKLGWNETNIVEHIGEVRSVISAVPMTREEFEAKYLKNSAED